MEAPTGSATSKVTAIDLLKDRTFKSKYPALAKALGESIGMEENGEVPKTAKQIDKNGQNSKTGTSVHTPPQHRQTKDLDEVTDQKVVDVGEERTAAVNDKLANENSFDTTKYNGVPSYLPATMSVSPILTGNMPREASSAPIHVNEMGSKDDSICTPEVHHQARQTEGGEDSKATIGEELDPPYHYMKRLDELKSGYLGIMQRRNAVEYQFHLLKSTSGRLGNVFQAPMQRPQLSSSPAFLLPSTHAAPVRTPFPYIYQPEQLSHIDSPVPSWNDRRMRSTLQPLGMESVAKGPIQTVTGSFVGRAGAQANLGTQYAKPKQLRMPEERKTEAAVDPAVLFVKGGMDSAMHQLESHAQTLRHRSREVGRLIQRYDREFESHDLRARNAHPLLNQLNTEQGTLIAEQLRSIDEAKMNLAVAQTEAARIEQYSRDAFYHASFADPPDPQAVKYHREKLEEIRNLGKKIPIINRNAITKRIAESLSDPLEEMENSNIDYKEQRLSAAGAQLAISGLLRNLGYQQHRPGEVPIRFDDEPACFKTKFPDAYPDPGYANSLPVTQEWRKERFKQVSSGGALPNFGDYVNKQQDDSAEDAAIPFLELQAAMKNQKQKQEEFDDWDLYCQAKKEARAARPADTSVVTRETAIKATKTAQQETDAGTKRGDEAEKDAAAVGTEVDRALSQKGFQKEFKPQKTKQPSGGWRDDDGSSRRFSRASTLQVEAAQETAEEFTHRRSMMKRGVSRTLSMHKTPLSRSASQARNQITSNDVGEGSTIHGTKTEALTVKDTFDVMQAPKRLQTAIPKQSRRKAEILNNALAARLPPYHCQQFVTLTPPVEPTTATLGILYAKMKQIIASAQLGNPDNAQTVYEFAFACCKDFIRDDSNSQEYANLLIEALPFYPYQIDIQRAGLVGLLNIFEASKFQEQLAPSIFDTMTTLMAIDDLELRADTIAVMASVIRPKVVINTDLVDLLLQILDESKDAEVICFCIHILLVTRSPHRKKSQYTAFVQILDKWKYESEVLIRTCLAIDAAARRAQLEILASHERAKYHETGARFESGYTNLKRSLTFSEALQIAVSNSPPRWMIDQFRDVDMIITAMELHANNRRLQGAASQALSALARVSLAHCDHVCRRALPVMIAASSTHQESQTIASALSSTISIVGRINACRRYLNEGMLSELKGLIHRHRGIPEVISNCCAAATVMDGFFLSHLEFFDNLTLHIIIGALRNSPSSNNLAQNANEFISSFSYYCETLADARRRATELGVVEAVIKSITVCSTDVLACVYGCRAIARLVYKQPSDSGVYADIIRTRAMSSLLFVLFKHQRVELLALDALQCIGNCLVSRDCAKSVMERGVNVICKAVDQHCDNVEVVAQGCRCLWQLSLQSDLEQLASNRGVLLIEHASSKYSRNPETKAIMTEFLLSVLNGKGIDSQSVDPMWDPSGRPGNN